MGEGKAKKGYPLQSLTQITAKILKQYQNKITKPNKKIRKNYLNFAHPNTLIYT